MCVSRNCLLLTAFTIVSVCFFYFMMVIFNPAYNISNPRAKSKDFAPFPTKPAPVNPAENLAQVLNSQVIEMTELISQMKLKKKDLKEKLKLRETEITNKESLIRQKEAEKQQQMQSFTTTLNAKIEEHKRDLTNLRESLTKTFQDEIRNSGSSSLLKLDSLRRPVFATICTQKTFRAVSLLVASVHKFYPPSQYPDMRFYIYGINLPQTLVDFINVWKGVVYVDLAARYVASEDIKATKSPIFDEFAHWKPLALKECLDYSGAETCMLLSPLSFLSSKITEIPSIASAVNTKGYVVIGGHPPGSELNTIASQAFEMFLGIFVAKNSKFHTEILNLSIECSMRQCSPTIIQKLHSQLAVPNKDFVSLHHFSMNGNNILDMQKQPTEQENRYQPCTIEHRDQFFTINDIPKTLIEGLSKWTSPIYKAKAGERKKIGIGFPATSKGNPNPQLTTLPPINTFIPTFINSIKGDSTRNNHHFVLYLGFDRGDTFYDTPTAQEAILKNVEEQIKNNGMKQGVEISFKMIRTQNTRGWVVYYWNQLFLHAMDEGCDYFYQLNDDIQFNSNDWAATFINNLDMNSKSIFPAGGFGVTGPTDQNNGNILTQSFVSRVHYNIFGYLYPYVFKNWFSDDWITSIYVPQNAIYRTSKYVRNAQHFGTRYEVCSMDRNYYATLPIHSQTANLVKEYLAARK